MASNENGSGGAPTLPAVRRLIDGRRLIAAAAALLAALVLTDLVAPIAAVVMLVGLAVLVAVIPPVAAGRTMRAPDSPAPATWPDTGIKLFAEALPDPCLILDRRAVVRFANRKAAEALGIRPGDPLTVRLRVPALLSAFDRVVKGGPAEGVEFNERVPTERWFAAWFARLDTGPQGEGNFIALILDDMTERRRSERIRVDFVANASHELRTPLASLVGFIDTLQGPARDDPEARQRFLKVMQDQATRMSRLIDDLLSLSRIELKEHVRPSGEVDLRNVMRHLSDALEPLAREMGVTINVTLPDDPALVVGDQDELIQVFENLIENACKYGQSGRRVDVAVRPAGDRAGPSVLVRDYGPGIPAEHIPRLTERFYRIDVEASRKHRGTGLGLAIVKHILARHQARLVVESQRGEGATFTVVFPQASPPGVAESEQIRPAISAT